MPSAVRLSDELVELARTEATVMHRSIAMQIEHWAQIGRLIESSAVSHQKVRDFLAGHLPADALNRDEENLAAESIFGEVMQTAQSSALESALRESGKPYYIQDERYPQQVIQVLPDGTRQLGKFKERLFIVEQELGKIES